MSNLIRRVTPLPDILPERTVSSASLTLKVREVVRHLYASTEVYKGHTFKAYINGTNNAEALSGRVAFDHHNAVAMIRIVAAKQGNEIAEVIYRDEAVYKAMKKALKFYGIGISDRVRKDVDEADEAA